MKQISTKYFVLVVLFILPLFAMAQMITGTVKDKDGELLPYVKVTEYRATNKAVTNDGGSFNIRVSMLPTKLLFNAIGYKEVAVSVSNKEALTVILEKEELGLKERLSVGNATKSRTTINSPVAISYISMKDIKATGSVSLDKILAYSEASFNSTNQTHADVTTHFDVNDLKGLGSSRMLVLVNGKRKNLSAIAHINDTYGKGEVGTDLKSIPVAAIDHIEILREGASSIYGSDAMAGVINVVLKKKTDFIIATYNAGITLEGDGLEAGGDINGTFSNTNGDYVNYTFAFQHQRFTDRNTDVGKDVFTSPNTNAWINDNPDLGMIVGQPGMNTGNVYFNAAKLFKNGEIYATVGGEIRAGESALVFSTPYMGTDPNNLYHGSGFQPILRSSIVDNMDVLGVKYNTNGFKIDLSGTFGINRTELFVDESLNPSMSGNDSPKSFDNGGYNFQNTIANLDITKSLDALNIAFGADYKLERYKIKQGEYDSWFDQGSTGFLGITHQNVLNEDRNSFGAYANLDYDITADFLFGASARYASYSDVGDQVSYKANARYKFADKGAIRASYGTNFRAPALQQMFMNYNQSNGTVLLNTAQRTLQGIADLEAETATNMNVGFFVTPMKNLNLSLDYYKVDIDNRVVLANNASGDKFFTNAINTETQGIDFTAKYDNIRFTKGVLGFILTANWNTTEIVGDTKKPASMASVAIFNRTERSRVETGRPSIKGKLGINYEMADFSIALNNSYFGDVTWQHATDTAKDQTFSAKFLTDIIASYQYSRVFSFNLAVNNLLNVYPDEIDAKGDVMTDLGGRYLYSTQLNQFGINGMNVRAGVTARF